MNEHCPGDLLVAPVHKERKGVKLMANTRSGKFEPNNSATREAARKGGQQSNGGNRKSGNSNK